MSKTRALLIYWLPVGLWMWLIFTASGDSASFVHSSRIIGPILYWLFPQISPEATGIIILCVRKGAHLTEYAVLALLLWRALRNSAARLTRPLVAPGRSHSGWNWNVARLSLLIVMLYAASDEFHQSFVPSRDAAVHDVLIDTTGALCGLLVLWAFGRWRKFW
jgi:VanZ family protein